MLETVWQDCGTARMLAKNPGFALVTILSIAIGVGANAAMFSVADGLILRPLPVPDANELMTVSATAPTGEVQSEYFISGLCRPSRPCAELRGPCRDRGVSASLARGATNRQGTFGQAVSVELLRPPSLRLALGRTFLPDEDRIAGRDAVVVLAHETWTEQFGADPAIVGREIRLTGTCSR